MLKCVNNCGDNAQAIFMAIDEECTGSEHLIACTRACAREVAFGTMQVRLPKGASITLVRKLTVTEKHNDSLII